MLIIDQKTGRLRKETYEEFTARMEARSAENRRHLELQRAAEESQNAARRGRASKKTAKAAETVLPKTRVKSKSARPPEKRDGRSNPRGMRKPVSECLGGCGFKLVPYGRVEVPEGHRKHAGLGRCNGCLRRWKREQKVVEKRERKGLPERCTVCNRPLVHANVLEVPEGSARHQSNGRCKTCDTRQRRGRPPRFVPPPNCVICGCDFIPRTQQRTETARPHASQGKCSRCYQRKG